MRVTNKGQSKAGCLQVLFINIYKRGVRSYGSVTRLIFLVLQRWYIPGGTRLYILGVTVSVSLYLTISPKTPEGWKLQVVF